MKDSRLRKGTSGNIFPDRSSSTIYRALKLLENEEVESITTSGKG